MRCRHCPRMDGSAVGGMGLHKDLLRGSPRYELVVVVIRATAKPSEGSEFTAESKAIREDCGPCFDSIGETICHRMPEGIVVTTTMFCRQNRRHHGAA